MFTRTTDPAGSREFVRPSYKHNVGTMSQIGGSISQGASGSLTATGLQVMAEAAARSRAWVRKEEPMTEEQFNTEGHDQYMDFEEGLYPDIVKIRRNYKVGQMVNQKLTEDMSWYGNLAGNLVGGTIADIGFMAAPVGALASRASATSKAMRLGNTLNVATSAEKLLSQGVVKGVRRAAATDLFAVSSASQFAESSLIYFGAQMTDRDHDISDIFMDTVLGGTVATGLFGIPHVLRTKRIARVNSNLLADKSAMETAVEQGDVMGISRILERNSPTFSSSVEADPELKSILQMGAGEIMESQNLGKRQKLVGFLEQNEDAIWYQHVRGLIPRDPELPVQQAIIKQEADKAAIVDATATGNYENLTGEQMEFIIKADEATAETLQLVGDPLVDSKVSTKVETYPKVAKRRNLPTPEVDDAPKLDLHQHSAKVTSELEANKLDRAKAAVGRRAEKRREVEKRQKVYAKSSKEQGSRNSENISKHLEQSAGWATTSFPNIGKSIDGFRQYLASLIDAEGGELSLDVTVDALIKLVDSDKLEYAPEVMLDIHGIKVTHAKARGVASKYFKDPKKNEQYIGPDNIDEGMSRRLSQLDLDVAEGRRSPEDATRAFNEYAIEMETASTVRRLHSESIFKKKRAELEGFSPKKIIKYLKSSIDGLNRSGVNLKNPAVQNAINAEITISQAPMHETLTKHKLYDAFIDADNELMTDIMQANRTGELPDRWKGENAAMFKEILEVYKQTTEALNGELNQYGANIRFLEGHSGVSQRWDSQTLLAAGYDKWSAHMMDAMDWEATRRNLGGVMAKERNEFGFAQDWKPADQEKYLQSMYDDLTAPRTDEDHPSMDIAKSFGRHRNIALKPEAEVETLSLYSGHDSMGQLWLDQVRYKAEMTAITRELGNNPIPTFRRLVEDAGLSEAKNTSRKKGVVGQKLHELDMKTMDWSLQYLTGKLDNPADLDVAQFGKTTRQISHILFLWQSSISAVTDIPMAIHTVSQLGGTAPTATMVSAFGRALRRRFQGDEPNMSSYLTQHGANFDAMMSAGARHMGLPDSKTAGSVISRMSEATFALNGLNAWTGIMQEAFIDVMTRDMASYLKAGKIDPSLRLSLEAAGVTEAEFLALGDFVENVAGVDRLNINNEKVSVETKRKLMAFLAKYRDEAIMMPDASTAGMIRAGTQSGTVKGEIMRTMFQYQSFPLAMNRIAARKFLVNPEGGRPWTTDQVTFSNTIGFIGGMLAMSYVATVLKDLANGREPMHMGNMTGESWVRLVNQSGMGGMLQSLMEIGSGNPKAVIAPIPSTALKVAGSDSIGEAIYQSRNIWSVGSMPIVAPVIQKAVAAVFDDAVGLHFDQLNTFHKMNTDQDPLFYAPR